MWDFRHIRRCAPPLLSAEAAANLTRPFAVFVSEKEKCLHTDESNSENRV